jgi:hypothetical protein
VEESPRAEVAGTRGPAGSEYRPTGAASWTTYTAPFYIDAQGASTWEYRSGDLAGNVETAESLTVKIDSRRPTTKAYAAAVKKGKKVKLAYQVSDAQPGCGQAAADLRPIASPRRMLAMAIVYHRGRRPSRHHQTALVLPTSHVRAYGDRDSARVGVLDRSLLPAHVHGSWRGP